MNRPEIASFKAIRAQLMSLTIKCQMGGNPEDCQLHKQRNLEFPDRVEWIKSLSDDEIFSLYSAHLDCLNAKGAALASS